MMCVFMCFYVWQVIAEGAAVLLSVEYCTCGTRLIDVCFLLLFARHARRPGQTH